MMKRLLEYTAVAMAVFLLATIDSYTTSTLLIGLSLFLIVWGFWMYQNKADKPSVQDLPTTKSDQQLAKWLKATIKKIDKMDDVK
jgi:hypothetical protein